MAAEQGRLGTITPEVERYSIYQAYFSVLHHKRWWSIDVAQSETKRRGKEKRAKQRETTIKSNPSAASFTASLSLE